MMARYCYFVLSIILCLCFISLAQAKDIDLRGAFGHDVILAKKGNKTYLRLDLKGLVPPAKTERTPVNIAIVIDQSGSMGGNKIIQAKEAAKLAVRRLGPNDILSIIAYSDQAHVLVPATKLTNKADVLHQINAIRATGRTALYAGTKSGIGEVEKYLSDNKVNRVVLLSDGLANVGPSKPSELEELGRITAGKSISISTIGLGLGYNEDLMSKLAFASDGNHAFVRHETDLVEIFGKEFGDVLSVIAKDVEIIINLHINLRPIRLLSRKAQIEGNKIKFRLNQLYSGQEKYDVLEIENLQDLKEGRGKIADIEVHYRAMPSAEKKIIQLTKEADISSSKERAQKSYNKRVMAGVAEQIATLKNEEAVKLRDQGKVKQAKKLLNDNAAYLEAEAKKTGTYGKTLEKLAADNKKDAKNLDQKNWNAIRKSMKARQHKSKSQQSF